MKLILSILLSLLSLNLFAADGALGTASGTTTVGTIPAGNLPALGVAYPNALTNNSTVAWTNTDNITALTFSGAGSGQGILQLSNAAATGLTVILGPSNAFANTILVSNTFNIYNGATLEANIDNSGNQTNAGNLKSAGLISTGSNWFTGVLDLEQELRATNAVGNTGDVLTSAGAGKAPYWTAPVAGSTWVKQILIGGMDKASGGNYAAGNNYSIVVGRPAANSGNLTSTSSSMSPAPTSGYLSNLVVLVQVPLASTTNIIFNVQTNVLGSAGVDSGLTCTLNGGGANYTNDSTHAVILGANYAFDVRFTPSAVVLAESISWSVEWWHQ